MKPIVGRSNGGGQRIPALGEIAKAKGKEYGVIGVAAAQGFGVCMLAEAHIEVAPMFVVPLHLLEYVPDDQCWKINVQDRSIITDIRGLFG